jgi:fumarylacetoacetase
MFRPDNPLLPNYKWVPVGYHGRASSVVISGTDIRRPLGQTMRDGAERPQFGPTLRLDYELEIGAFVGPGNPLGAPISIDRAEDHLFGLCIVNDWSARDIQKWEYQPLGPFLAKSFATSVSPWVVTVEALLPYRVPASARDVEPLEYLRQGGADAFDVQVAAYLRSESMRAKGLAPVQVSSGNLRDLYWTFAQMVTHHSSNGCNLRTGDLIASGTVSGAGSGSQGCLLELTRGGKQALELPSGEDRRFLEDGDEVFLRAWCERDGAVRVGFGTCSGMVLATDERG